MKIKNTAQKETAKQTIDAVEGIELDYDDNFDDTDTGLCYDFESELSDSN
jgi:hypothetical protein